MYRFIVLLSALVLAVVCVAGLHAAISNVASKPEGGSPAQALVRASATPAPTTSPVPVTVEIATSGPTPSPTTRPRPTAPPRLTPTTSAPQVAMNVQPGGYTQSGATVPVEQASQPAPPAATQRTVRLTNYWISRHTAAPGSLISFTYVVDNETGQTVRLWLGASIMAATNRSWGTQSVSDPAHDVIATIPPGVSTHLRYFAIPRTLVSGMYDVGWGLKTVAEQPVTFVAVPRELQIRTS